MWKPPARNVLHRGIVSEKVVGRDALDLRIVKHGPKRKPEAFDVPRFWSDEDVEIFGETSKAVEVESHRAEDHITNTEAFERRENPA